MPWVCEESSNRLRSLLGIEFLWIVNYINKHRGCLVLQWIQAVGTALPQGSSSFLLRLASCGLMEVEGSSLADLSPGDVDSCFVLCALFSV